MFDSNEIEFMKKIGINIDFDKDLSEENSDKIEELVSDYLQIYGFDENYDITNNGILCESILDKLI
jgi:hypothetical protein